MSFDASRFRFNPQSDYLGVVMQQGRVQLDSDWNELVSQLTRRIHVGTLDTFSVCVVPRVTPHGFEIRAQGGKLQIGSGRIYVDGILAENHRGEDVWDARLAELRLAEDAWIDFDQQPFYDGDAPPNAGRHLV
ncbi:MAG TPA: DUF6519 domain-containing protein, partial [Gemmatimonadaceae bacterium]|nr:DUF6519 domain-containing protein [Gemmatimonadaceae bacterium]